MGALQQAAQLPGQLGRIDQQAQLGIGQRRAAVHVHRAHQHPAPVGHGHLGMQPPIGRAEVAEHPGLADQPRAQLVDRHAHVEHRLAVARIGVVHHRLVGGGHRVGQHRDAHPCRRGLAQHGHAAHARDEIGRHDHHLGARLAQPPQTLAERAVVQRCRLHHLVGRIGQHLHRREQQFQVAVGQLPAHRAMAEQVAPARRGQQPGTAQLFSEAFALRGCVDSALQRLQRVGMGRCSSSARRPVSAGPARRRWPGHPCRRSWLRWHA